MSKILHFKSDHIISLNVNRSKNKTDKENINTFLGLCLLFGSVKFFVLRNAFSNNPLYYHSIVKKILSGRRFEQLFNTFSVEYSETIVIVEGLMRKIEPVYTMLINNSQNAFYPHVALFFRCISSSPSWKVRFPIIHKREKSKIRYKICWILYSGWIF